MADGLAVASANSILNVYRNTAYAAVAAVYVQLHTGAPGAAGTSNISVGSTTRNAVTWNAASGGSMTLATLSAWTNGGTTETITDITLWTLASSGVFLQSCQLTTPQPWASTNTLTITTLTLNYTPVAA